MCLNVFKRLIFYGYLVQCSEKTKEVSAEGVDYFRSVNTSHKGFLIAMFEKLIRDCPGVYYLVMKSNVIFSGDILIMSIG